VPAASAGRPGGQRGSARRALARVGASRRGAGRQLAGARARPLPRHARRAARPDPTNGGRPTERRGRDSLVAGSPGERKRIVDGEVDASSRCERTSMLVLFSRSGVHGTICSRSGCVMGELG